MIYAIRATEEGRKFVHSQLETLSLQRATILCSCLDKQWTTWTTINNELKTLADSIPEDNEEMKKYLLNYLNNISRIVIDVLGLEKLSLIEAARYRAPTGQYIREKPTGMVFR